MITEIKKIVLLVCTLLVFGHNLSAQKNLDEHVKELIQNQNYIAAEEILKDITSSDKKVYFQKGITYFHTNKLELAINNLTSAYEKGHNDPLIVKYLGMAHHKKGEFFEASRAYKLFLNEIDDNDPQRSEVITLIKQCGYGTKAIHMDAIGFSENLGTVVNTPYNEYAPVQSPNFSSKYYFSSDRSGSTGGLRNKDGLKDDLYGHYSSDIYAVEIVNGSWIPSTGVPPLLNSARNEDIQGFSENGRVLVFMKEGGGQPTQIVADTFSAEIDAQIRAVSIPCNAELGDRDLYFVNDSTILFSSRRMGGYGGYDLYITQRDRGVWSVPENLGEEVNSRYDERTPFLSNSNTLLYFSSNRTESQGGFDVFRADYGVERGKWNKSVNVGTPISSPGNDLYFRLNEDGRSGIFSSDRKEAIGGMDLFIIYLKSQIYEQLAFTPSIPFLNRPEDLSGISSEPDPAKPVVNKKETETKPAIKNREIVISPLYYNLNTQLIDGNNRKELKNILDMMIIYPEADLTLVGNTTSEGSKAYDLYFSIKRAENASDYLVTNGINPERIFLKGLGSNYPMVKNLNSPMANKNNRRIDVEFSDMKEKGLLVSYNKPIVAEYIRDERFDQYTKKVQGLTYRIIVASVKQMYDNEIIMRLPDVTIEKRASEDRYTYKAGLYSSYFDSRDAKNAIIRNGILDVKIEAYMNGKLLSQEDIEVLKGAYPDLIDYINYEAK